MSRICAEPGCPTITSQARCPQHTAARDHARGNRHARGYGHDHNKLRAQWSTLVASGLVACRRCHLLITPGQAWHLDHSDDRTHYLGPSHAACNLAAGGRASHRRGRPT